jgi:hypothetical protein
MADNPFLQSTFSGLHVSSNPNIPLCPNKISLSYSVDVSPEFREEFNLWLRDFFGTEEPTAYLINADYLINQHTEKIRDSFKVLKPTSDKWTKLVCHPDFYSELMRIAEKRNIAVITASQANR